MWFIYAILSASIYSIRSLLEKWSLKSVDPYILALAVRSFALPLFVLPFVFGFSQLPDLSELPFRFWGAVFLISFVSTPMEMIFFYKALKTEEVSFVVPLLGLSPLVTMFFSFLLFREAPTIWGMVGTALIILALYLLNTQKQQESFLDPIRHLMNNKAFIYILLMLLSYSLGILIDKVGIMASDIYFYSLVNYLFVSIALLLIALVKAPEKFVQLRTNFTPFLLIGLVVAGYTWLRFASLKLGNPGYVAAVLSSHVLFSIVAGAMIFREKDLKKKTSVGMLILVGLVLIKALG